MLTIFGIRHAQGRNGRSVGIIVRHGRFSMLDLGDLTWNFEHNLVCPTDRLGTVDVYLTTHHGLNLSGPRLCTRCGRECRELVRYWRR